jgi:phenylacetic acid degradation protein PaaD
MKIHQLSIFLENKPGHLDAACKALSVAGISILTLSLADTQQFGILRLIVKDWEKAKSVLEAKGFVVNVTEMVATEIMDEPGGLQRILAVVDTAGLNIEYMYAFAYRRENAAVLLFRFDKPDDAIRALKKAGIGVLGKVDLFESSGEACRVSSSTGGVKEPHKQAIKDNPRERMEDDAFAKTTGVRLLTVEPGTAEAELRIEPRHLNGVGVVHGGVLFTLADFAFASASNAYGPSALAIDGHIQFHRSGLPGDMLTATARETSRSRTLGRYEVTVHNQLNELLSSFFGTAYIKA